MADFNVTGLPIQIEVWNKSYQRRGFVGAPLSVSATKRRNAAGDCSFTVRADHPRVADLMTSGMRCVVSYRYDENAPWMRLISGRVQTRAGQGALGQSTRTFTLRDDWTILQSTLAWPSPGSDIDHQSSTAFYTQTGPAETVALKVIKDNYVTRLGGNLTVPTSLGRGATITLKTRMDYLADKLFPAIDDAGIILDIGQVGDHREITVRTPATYGAPLTEESGAVRDPQWSTDDPLSTRVIVGVGGQSEDIGARLFRQFLKSAWESDIGEPLELYADGSSIALTDDITAESTKLSDDTFSDNAAKTNLNVTLAEAGAFKFGKTFLVGDNVPVLPNGLDVPILDHVRETEVSWTAGDGDGSGLKIASRVGAWDDSSDAALFDQVALLGKALRSMQRR